MTKYLDKKIVSAIKADNLDAVRKFLKKYQGKPDVINACDEGSKNTMLILAVIYKKDRILQELVACKDVDVNLSDNRYKTALIYAAEFSNINAVRILLSRDDIRVDSFCITYGDTALLHAARKGNIEIVKLLLDHGAKRETSDFARHTAESEAVLYGHPEVADLIKTYIPEKIIPKISPIKTEAAAPEPKKAGFSFWKKRQNESAAMREDQAIQSRQKNPK